MYTAVEIKDYTQLNQMLKGLIEDETERIANLSNAASMLNQFLENINWVGFYLYKEETDELVLGPFQGLTACVRIQIGKGVCGTASSGNDIYIIDHVSEFPGHLSCNGYSKSDIGIPIYKYSYPIGVHDIDAPVYERVTEEDRSALSVF